ncbi:MAG: hypothetical protein LBC45_01315 [Chlamydiales bacterium]|jgi:hypothetical protein|nr:hypothetical protein [Chlamydiales bacterium]
MKIVPFSQLLVHTNFIPFNMECSKFLNRLRHVISKNLRQNREDHELRSSQMDKGIKRIRQMSKASVNTHTIQNDYLNVAFFRSHLAPCPGETAQ